MHIDDTSYKSPNYNARPYGMAIDCLVIHTTEGPWPSDIEWLCANHSEVSAHYCISPTGEVYQLVADELRAWHAGNSYYAGRADYNDFSIGIELSHVAGDTYSNSQAESLTELSKLLIPLYSIPKELIVKHAWIAQPTGRRSDPTNWSDSDFRLWIDTLYHVVPPADPLKVRSIPGASRNYYCGVGFYDLYYKGNGIWWLGLPHSDETPAIDAGGRECTYMAFERATLKYSSQEGVRTALESEAIALGWI